LQKYGYQIKGDFSDSSAAGSLPFKADGDCFTGTGLKVEFNKSHEKGID
jgi:hypothetical protein